MNTKRKLNRSTATQLKLLVEYMSTHQQFASGEYTGPLGARNHNEEWRQLKLLLSEHGPDKSVDQWKQCWRDMKRKARANNAAAQRALAQTGNVGDVPIVSDIDKTILDTIGHESSVGIGPLESPIGEALVQVQNDTQDEDIIPPPPVFAEEADENMCNIPPLPRSRSLVPQRFIELQEQLNAHLSEICKLNQHKIKIMTEQTNVMKERNKILKERNYLLRNRSEQRRRRFY